MSYQDFLQQLSNALNLRGILVIDFHVSFDGYVTAERDRWSFQLLYMRDGDETMTGKIIQEYHPDLAALLEQVKAKIDLLEQPQLKSNLLIIP